MDNLKRWIASSRARSVLGVVGALLVALLIFHAGVSVGSHRHARTVEAGRWGFRAPGFGHVGLPHGFVEEGHGAIGVVQSVASSTFVLATRAGTTQTVRLASTTSVRSASGATSTAALAPGERVVVLGTPDSEGALEADVIRLFQK